MSEEKCFVCGEGPHTYPDPSTGELVSDMGYVFYDGPDKPGRVCHSGCLGNESLWKRIRAIENRLDRIEHAEYLQ